MKQPPDLPQRRIMDVKSILASVNNREIANKDKIAQILESLDKNLSALAADFLSPGAYDYNVEASSLRIGYAAPGEPDCSRILEVKFSQASNAYAELKFYTTFGAFRDHKKISETTVIFHRRLEEVGAQQAAHILIQEMAKADPVFKAAFYGVVKSTLVNAAAPHNLPPQ